MPQKNLHIPLLITEIADAYLEAVDSSELDELIQLDADKDRANREINELLEAHPRSNALANKGQIEAITTWISRYAPHAEKNWFNRFTKSILGQSVAMNRLTVAQASQIEISLNQISRTRAYGSEWNTANLALDLHYKFDLYPDDPERAKATYRACQQRLCYQVSMGRVNHPKFLTRGEAREFSKLVDAIVPSVVTTH